MVHSKDIQILYRIFTIVYFFFLAVEILAILRGVHTYFNVALIFLNSCIFIPLIIRSKRLKDSFPLDPFFVFGLWFALSYFISTTPFYISQDSIRLFSTTNVNVFKLENINVIITLGIGIVSFYLGYTIISGRKKKVYNYIKTREKISRFLPIYYRLILGAYIFSILFRIYGYSIGAMGSLSARSDVHWPPIPLISVFVFLANIWPIYLAGLMLSALEKRNKNTIIILFIIEIIFVLVSGDRRNLIFVLFIFLYCYRVVNKELPWRLIKIAFPLTLLSLPFLTLIGYTMIYIDEVNLTTIPEILSLSLNQLFSLSISEIVEDYIYSPIIESYGFITNVFVANTEFAARGDVWGSVGLQNIMSKMVPGFLGGGAFDERRYYQLFAEKYLTYRVDYSHLTFTFATEMVLSYGLLAIPMGMFLQGVFSSYLFKLSQSNNCSPLFFIFYCGYGYKFSLGLLNGLLTPDFMVGFRALAYLAILLLLLRLFGTKSIKHKVLAK